MVSPELSHINLENSTSSIIYNLSIATPLTATSNNISNHITLPVTSLNEN